jgi:S-(hydroxymethyl)glutathione dehydrogenase/alcohol dehydrogenase
MEGKIKVSELVSRKYPLDGINTAYDALANGEVARSILTFDN